NSHKNPWNQIESLPISLVSKEPYHFRTDEKQSGIAQCEEIPVHKRCFLNQSKFFGFHLIVKPWCPCQIRRCEDDAGYHADTVGEAVYSGWSIAKILIDNDFVETCVDQHAEFADDQRG